MAVAAKFDAMTVQGDLIKLGYLPKKSDDGRWGGGSKRAIIRFKRRATTLYRMSSATAVAADCSVAEVFREPVDEQVTEATLLEIQKWLTKQWRAPLGRFALKSVANGKLREDVADAWTKAVASIAAKGGTIEGPYGDTKRAMHKAGKVGASSYSFHIVGRAIDLKQELANRAGRRYYVVREDDAGRTFWRIYCSVADGFGEEMAKGDVKWWDFADKKEIPIPAGRYLDLTSELDDAGFERIAAQGGWQAQYNKSEWWHYQWEADKQATFEDECELIGISTAELKGAGYSEHDLDHKPG